MRFDDNPGLLLVGGCLYLLWFVTLWYDEDDAAEPTEAAIAQPAHWPCHFEGELFGVGFAAAMVFMFVPTSAAWLTAAGYVSLASLATMAILQARRVGAASVSEATRA